MALGPRDRQGHCGSREAASGHKDRELAPRKAGAGKKKTREGPGQAARKTPAWQGRDGRLCPSSDGWRYHPKGAGLILRQAWDPRGGQQGKQDKERVSTKQRGLRGAEQRLGFLLEGRLGQRDRCCCSTGWSSRGPTLGCHGNCRPFWRGAHLAQPNFLAASGPCGSRDGRHSLQMELSPRDAEAYQGWGRRPAT